MRRFKKVMFSRICSNVSVEMLASHHSDGLHIIFLANLLLFSTLTFIASSVTPWYYIMAGIIGLFTLISFHGWYSFKSRVIDHQESKDHG